MYNSLLVVMCCTPEKSLKWQPVRVKHWYYLTCVFNAPAGEGVTRPTSQWSSKPPPACIANCAAAGGLEPEREKDGHRTSSSAFIGKIVEGTRLSFRSFSIRATTSGFAAATSVVSPTSFARS